MRNTVGVRVAMWLVLVGAATCIAPQVAAAWNGPPSFGSNVVVFTPSMPQQQVHATLNQIAIQQVPNQFGTQRYAIFFEPGTYGSQADPLIFQVGYYTQVAGLGAQPGGVTINGAIEVFNQCPAGGGPCDGLNNFWRSLSNLTLNVTLPKTPPTYVPDNGEDPGCRNTNEMWAVSQAAPMRRVIMNGTVTLQDYCNEGFVSGGFLADDEFTGGVVINAGQQQFFTRNSNIDNWTNSVWNQVFLGDNGAPATSFGPSPAATTNPQYTTLATTPVSQSEPFLYTDSRGDYSVFVPAVQHDSVGPSYGSGDEAGASIPIRRFFIANPDTPVWAINAALAFGQNLILTPGVYNLRSPIVVTHPGTVVMGLGFATLIPQDGNVAMETADVPGIKLSGMIIDAGPRTSYALLEVGSAREHFRHGLRDADWSGGASDPTLVQDVFFRVGGAASEPVHTKNALVVNTDNTILDDVWAWRADHGNDVGWTTNTADTGVIVNGDNVKAYGLFVEHFQKFEVIWNGRDGEDVFFQNEMPYDPPSQSAWMSSPTTDGYAAFLVTPHGQGFQGYGMGSYSFFNQGVPVFATQAFQSPASGVQFHNIFTLFLNKTASGGINSVINGCGGPSIAANADTPIDVNLYPPCPSG
jgi:hypothetical protein